MTVYPTNETIEVVNNGIVIDGKLIEQYDKVIEERMNNGQTYLNCLVWSNKFETYLSEDCFKVEA